MLYPYVLQQKPNKLSSQEILQELLSILELPDISGFFL